MLKRIVIATLLCGVLQASSHSEKLRYVIDGDTVQFSDTRCRLAYIDTPESQFNNKLKRDIKHSSVTADEVIDAGRVAKRYLKSKLNKGTEYSFNVTGTDRYHRSICVIYLNGESLNDRIVEDGMAVPFWRYVPLSKKMKMVSLLRFAKKNKKGLWRISPKVLDMMNH